MDILFRPVFTRVKTPVIGSGSLPEHHTIALIDDAEPEEIITINTRLRTTPRVSPYMGFRPATPPIPAPETFPNLRNPESVYYKPSGDQLAEMLKVVMMNQSTMDPVPIEYNSTILHVLEAYHDLRVQLAAKEEALEALKQSHTKDIKDFEELASEWHQKENDYKVEMKKLEVLLSNTEGGMESVAMARSMSVIHGMGKASDIIKRGIGTIKSRNSAHSGNNIGFGSPDLASPKKRFKPRSSVKIPDNRDIIVSASFADRRLRRKHTMDSWSSGEQFPPTIFHNQGSSVVQLAKASLQGSVHGIQSLTKVQLEALARQQAQEFGVNFESSASGADSSSISYRSEILAYRAPLLGLGILENPLENPLPDIPMSADERAKQTSLHKYLKSRQHSYSDPNTATPVKQLANYDMGFSFQPGDDDEILARRSSERDRAQRKAVDERLGYRPSMPNLRTGSITPTSNSKAASNRPRSLHAQSKGIKPSQLPRIQDNDHPLSRMDSSSSSIITAIRDNSGRSSTNDSQAGRPKLKRHTAGTGSGGSGAVTAATAAARAYATGSKMPSNECSRKASSSEESRKYPQCQDSESSRKSTANRHTYTTSMNSSSIGSETGNGKKSVA